MEYCNPGLWRSIVPFFTVLFSSACVCGGIQVRLDPGPNYGNVEMNHNGTWQRACLYEYFYHFGRYLPSVMCKQLGFNTTRNIGMRQTGTQHGLFWYTWIRCSPGDRHLSQCNVGRITNRTSCSDYYIPRIACLSDNETRVDIMNHNITVADGLSFNTRCNVYTPHTSLSYHWNHNWKNVSYSGRYFSGKGNRTVAGNWTCSVSSNGKTLGSDSTVINVIYPPKRMQSKIIYVKVGDSVSLSETDVSFPSPEMFTWRRLDTNSSFVRSWTPPVMSNIQQADAGEYIVMIQQPAYHLTPSAPAYRGNYSFGVQLVKIRIPYPPSIQCEEVVRVVNGQSRTVQCKVDSYPRHHVMTWTLATTAGTRTQSSHKDTLHIVNASAGDEGTYTCRATNNLTYPDGQVETGNGTCVIKVKVTLSSGGRSAAEGAVKGASDQETTSAVWGGLALVAIVVIGLLTAVIVLVIRQPDKKEVPNGDKPIEMTTVNRTRVAAISGPLYENAQDHRRK
ncbi:opioid-binding protein/cell adhesion molecule homolog [Haliotis cracherodii]|uniref:opioid-binding protein/cell adhesion molecule homolog n=1 Tax=Haliotis cracherodii TaxID=6455 RepID=UPI0039EC6BC8